MQTYLAEEFSPSGHPLFYLFEGSFRFGHFFELHYARLGRASTAHSPCRMMQMLLGEYIYTGKQDYW